MLVGQEHAVESMHINSIQAGSNEAEYFVSIERQIQQDLPEEGGEAVDLWSSIFGLPSLEPVVPLHPDAFHDSNTYLTVRSGLTDEQGHLILDVEVFGGGIIAPVTFAPASAELLLLLTDQLGGYPQPAGEFGEQAAPFYSKGIDFDALLATLTDGEGLSSTDAAALPSSDTLVTQRPAAQGTEQGSIATTEAVSGDLTHNTLDTIESLFDNGDHTIV